MAALTSCTHATTFNENLLITGHTTLITNHPHEPIEKVKTLFGEMLLQTPKAEDDPSFYMHKIIIAHKQKTVFLVRKNGENTTILVRENKLNQGQHGKVYKIRNIITGELHILKKARKVLTHKDRPKTKTPSRLQINNEDLILKQLHSKGLVKYLQAPFDFIVRTTLYPCEGYVTEEIDFDLGEDKRKALPFNERLQRCGDLITGLAFIHSCNLYHGDIKPSNCASKNGEWQIIDFGGAGDENNQNLIFSPAYAHSADKIALALEKSSRLHRRQKHDVYSLGLTLLEILTGNNLLTLMETRTQVQENNISQYLFDRYRETILNEEMELLKNDNEEVVLLIKDMIKERSNEPGKDRLSSQEVLEKFATIQQNLNSSASIS